MKKITRIFSALLAAVLIFTTISCSDGVQITLNKFEYQETTVPNPMKGFASLFCTPTEDSSLEYVGIKFSDVYLYDDESEGHIDELYIDSLLSSVAERGNTLILRTYIVYPGYNNETSTGLYLPEKLYEELNQVGYISSTKYNGHTLEFPNFNSTVLVDHMVNFITQLGEKYDGHPALAAIQLGLYGSWGEWNMSGCNNGRFAMNNKNMSRLLDAYTASFKTTKLMARNPSLGKAYSYDVGYHDDNFLFNTSDFHKQSPEWKALLKSLDSTYGTLQQFYDFINGCNGQYKSIWDKWQTQMFGGELSGMMYHDPFGPILEGTEREALDYCIQQFHVSWISGVGRGGIPEKDTEAYQKYLEIANSFGYKIGIESVAFDKTNGKMTVTLTNYGVAPFYYDWNIEYTVVDKDGNIVFTAVDEEIKLSQLLPEGTLQSSFTLPKRMKHREYSVRMRVVNPAETLSNAAKPMKLANNHAVTDGIYEIATIKVR